MRAQEQYFWEMSAAVNVCHIMRLSPRFFNRMTAKQTDGGRRRFMAVLMAIRYHSVTMSFWVRPQRVD